jgi:hypothetical protein
MDVRVRNSDRGRLSMARDYARKILSGDLKIMQHRDVSNVLRVTGMTRLGW